MSKHSRAIRNYEKCRQEVERISKLRTELINNCTKYISPTSIIARGLDDGVDICLVRAMDETKELNNNDYSYFYSFSEVLESNENEDYCQNCIDSYAIKKGPLAEAKKNFGSAKRALSILGKSILKSEEAS